MKNYVKKFVRLVFGLFVFAMGVLLTIQANIGLAPWTAFSMGIHYKTQLSLGNVMVISGLLIFVLDIALKEKIGFGTLLDALLIGKFIDLFESTKIIPMATAFWPGLGMLLLGQLIISLGSYFYIGAGLSCGPRDALMVGLGKRLPRVPIGAIRGSIEGTVLVIGWLLGAKVGLGTVISVFGIGFILQFTFKLLRFDVRAVMHESFADTLKLKSRIPLEQ